MTCRSVASPWNFAGESPSARHRGHASRSSRDRRSASRAGRATSRPVPRRACSSATPGSCPSCELRVNGQVPEPLAATRHRPVQRRRSCSGTIPLRGRADSAPRGLPPPLRRPRDAGGHRRAQLRRGARVLLARAQPSTADFADLFEVKEGRVEKTGELAVEADGSRHRRSRYRRGAFARGHRVDFSSRAEASTATSRPSRSSCPAAGQWSTCLQVTPVIDDDEVEPRYRCGRPVERADAGRAARSRGAGPARDHDATTTSFEALLDPVDRGPRPRCGIFDPDHPDRAVVAAGAPWFMTLFGRDSLHHVVDGDDRRPRPRARHARRRWPASRATTVNPLTEEEPGRILHEMRFGEAADAVARRRARSTTAAPTPRRCS